ncbi:MAG: UbiX family flavin prenyltransferase [Epsilonproteobacteria bacterium]|nr:UbiX family flavin prenyltransferase [Campylobacterota bacterium]
MKIVVAVSGASGANLGIKFIEKLPKNYEKFLIVSENAKIVLKEENNIEIFENSDIAASVSSGSFKTDITAIIPCSMNTLAKIACGIADNLTTRAASVAIKERKKLLLAPREMPFSSIALENMLKLSNLGVIIAPPVAGFYSDPKNLEEMENFFIGKWFDLLGIENNLFKRWGEE